jgi:glycosyltransferase involved in cell wall biosynthesis
MPHNRQPIVTFVTRILPGYRIAFYERVRALLAAAGIDYQLLYGQPNRNEAAKGDLVALPWARAIRNRALMGHDKLLWQPILKQALRSDLIVLGQENRLLTNYLLQFLPSALRPKIALWGHGPNFLSANWQAPGERWRHWWASRCDWWFGYTEASRAYVESTGFPPERITICNNAVDTDALHQAWLAVTPRRVEERRAELGLNGANVAIYVGAIYDFKRIDFLIRSADLIRAAVPDFELLVVGSGVDTNLVEAAAATRPWLKALGSRFGADKVELMRLAKLFVMPGLLGLAVLDAAATQLPVVTTNYRHHSPEIVYLEDGRSGIIVDPWDDAAAYSQAVIDLLHSPETLERMAAYAATVAERYTIEQMAERFVAGTLAALQARKR